jgi:peroxiredoxin
MDFTVASDRMLKPGDAAPAVTLPAVNRPGAFSLNDSRGHRALFVGLFRGLHCPFCRRQIVRLSTLQPQLAQADIEMVAVINTPLDRARLYFEFRPTSVILLADPGAESHRAFRVPAIEFSSEGRGQWPFGASFEQFTLARVNPTGELPGPVTPFDANATLNAMDHFDVTAVDEAIFASHGTQLVGHFLIDRSGTICWTHQEAPEGPSQIGVLPTAEEIVAAARTLPT